MFASSVLFVLFLSSPVWTNATNKTSDKIVQNYNQKICSHLPTCHLIDDVPSDYRDLRRRNCMCDEQCSLYGDCCADSKYANTTANMTSNITCVSTYSSGNVSMIVKCPSSWNESQSLRDYCESAASRSKQPDYWRLIPVTNRVNRLTYRNVFCAICNRDTNVTFWNAELSFRRKHNATGDVVNLSPDKLYANITFNSSDSGSCESYVNGTTYSCEMHGTLPVADEKYVRFCVPNVIGSCKNVDCVGHTSYAYKNGKVYKNSKCAECNGVVGDSAGCNPSIVATTRILSPYILTVDVLPVQTRYCAEMGDAFPYIKSQACRPAAESAPKTTAAAKDTCAAPKNCKIDAFLFIGPDVDVVDNQTIYLKAWGVQYPDAEYLMLNESYVYVCGHYVPRTPFQEFFSVLDDWTSEILIKFSLFFLLMHLLFFQQLPEMKNLSGKNLAAFCSTLFVALTCFEIGPWLPHCVYTAIVQHYAFMSCFAWMLVMSYDCWLSLYRATKKFRSSGGKKHTSRFTLYCLLCWIVVPGAVVGVALYFEFTPASTIPCNLKPGYGTHDQCFISQRAAMYFFFFAPASCMFLGNIAFFVHTAVMIYLSQRRTVNPNTRNDFKLYTRLALMMGLTWTLGSITTLTDNVIVAFLFSVFNMSQGIFIFFAFTFKQKILRQLLNKHKDNSIISTTLSTFVCESTTQDPASTRMHGEQSAADNHAADLK